MSEAESLLGPEPCVTPSSASCLSFPIISPSLSRDLALLAACLESASHPTPPHPILLPGIYGHFYGHLLIIPSVLGLAGH